MMQQSKQIQHISSMTLLAMRNVISFFVFFFTTSVVVFFTYPKRHMSARHGRRLGGHIHAMTIRIIPKRLATSAVRMCRTCKYLVRRLWPTARRRVSLHRIIVNERTSRAHEQQCLVRKYPPEFFSNTNIVLPLDVALRECTRRQADKKLMEQVTGFLGHDLPPSFQHTPVLHLARHVATPNYETLLFLHKAQARGYSTSIGTDSHDLFVSNNCIKHALGKLRFITGEHDGQVRHYEHTIVDFNTYSGTPFNEVPTLWGENLVAFHERALRVANQRSDVLIADDADWIDRHERQDIKEHYKYLLSLFVVHGILFEDYIPADKDEVAFMHDVIAPAYSFVEKHFGLPPLIVSTRACSHHNERFWYGYPEALGTWFKGEISVGFTQNLPRTLNPLLQHADLQY